MNICRIVNSRAFGITVRPHSENSVLTLAQFVAQDPTAMVRLNHLAHRVLDVNAGEAHAIARNQAAQGAFNRKLLFRRDRSRLSAASALRHPFVGAAS